MNGELAAGENRPCIIDQDVDARLLAGDFGGHPFHTDDDEVTEVNAASAMQKHRARRQIFGC
jgi:hypothetical protein